MAFKPANKQLHDALTLRPKNEVTMLQPLYRINQPKALVASKRWKDAITTHIRVNKTAIWLEGSTEKYTGERATDQDV